MIRRHRRVIACLAVVALLGGITAIFAAPAKSRQVVDEILGALVICTAHGAQALTSDGGLPDTPDADHCPLCTLLDAFEVAVLALVMAFMLVPSVALKIESASGRTLADHLCLGGIHSRAPPLAA